MKKLLNQYMKEVSEPFNKEWILSRNDDNILQHVRDIFKSLEILPEIHIDPNDITLETDESTFGPIKQQGKYYKPVLASRLNKIHYKVTIDGIEKPIEKDLYMNKMLDHCFYINEGIRYFLVWQIVDSSSYSFENGVAFKSLLMPIILISKNRFTTESFKGRALSNLPIYESSLFKKLVPPILYILGKYALESLSKAGMTKIADVDAFTSYNDPGIIQYLSDFFGFEIKFSDKLDDLIEDGRDIFTIQNNKKVGCYFSIPEDKVDSKEGRALIASLCYLKQIDKKANVVFSYDNLINMWYWLNLIAGYYNKSNDIFKKYEKIKGVYISLKRLIDEPTRKILRLDDEYKQDVYGIFKYSMMNFDYLSTTDGQDLTNKRIRLYEYVLYPLRSYFGKKIYSILTDPTVSIQKIEKIFTSLSPMYLIKECITSELLHYFNSTNEYNLYGALLRYTFGGPQGYTNSVSIAQRSLHPSYTGRLSLIASNAGNPGISGTVVPFIKVYDGYFTKK